MRTSLLYRVLPLPAMSGRGFGLFCAHVLYRVFATAALALSAFPLLTRYNIFLGITYVVPNSVQSLQAGHRNILLDIPIRLLGFPQAPDRAQSARSNTPCGVAFPLLLVARSRTSAREYQCPFRIPFHTVWDNRKSKGPSGVDWPPGLADYSQCRSPQGQNL